MNRIKRGVNAHQRHKKLLKSTKGYYGRRSKCFRIAKQAHIKAMQYNYRDRHQRKRFFRRTWITRINGALKSYDMSYSTFIHKLKEAQIDLNRKMLAELALYDNDAFQQLILRI